MISLKQAQAFLADYEKLVEKHQLGVFGWGCCDSPFVDDLEGTDPAGAARALNWDDGIEQALQALKVSE